VTCFVSILVVILVIVVAMVVYGANFSGRGKSSDDEASEIDLAESSEILGWGSVESE